MLGARAGQQFDSLGFVTHVVSLHRCMFTWDYVLHQHVEGRPVKARDVPSPEIMCYSLM
jgi:hypothetical protein